MSAPAILLSIIAPGHTDPERPEDLKTRVAELSVLRSEKQAPKATLSIRNDDNRYPDDPTFEVGAVLVLSWGYYPQRMSPPRRFIVQKWTAGVPTFKVEAHGEAVLLHKETRTRVFEDMSPVEVVREIARRAGYGPDEQDVDPFDTVKRPTITQRGYTDADMLRRIAKRHSVNGLELIWYVDEVGFHFHVKRLGQKPRVTKTYVAPPGEGDFKSFPSFEASPVQKPGSITVKSVDPVTQKPISVTVTNASTSGRPGLAPVSLAVDRRTGDKSFTTASAAETTVTSGANTEAEAKAQAGAMFSRATTTPMKATATLVGDPFVDCRIVATWNGLGRRLSGNYYYTKVTDSVKAGNFEQKVEVHRDGLSAGGAGPAPQSSAKVNDAVGPATGTEGESMDQQLAIDARSGAKKTTWTPSTGKS